MKIAAARRMAWGLLAFGTVLAGAGLVLSALNGERGGLLSITLFTLTFLGFGLTGSLVASRRPDNSIGWLLLGTALGLVYGRGPYLAALMTKHVNANVSVRARSGRHHPRRWR